MIVNKDRKKAEEAFQALGKDDSAKNWKKVAKKYSEDPTGRENGGLQKGIQEGILEEPLGGAVFATPEGQVEGPLKAEDGYMVFEVENSTPENVQKLETVESQIQSTLAQRAEQEYFTTFVAQFSAKWTQRTFCASGYATERCANYKGSGHPSHRPGRLLRSRTRKAPARRLPGARRPGRPGPAGHRDAAGTEGQTAGPAAASRRRRKTGTRSRGCDRRPAGRRRPARRSTARRRRIAAARSAPSSVRDRSAARAIDRLARP